MVWYQWGKIATGILMALTFTGWMILQWSSPLARTAIASLILVTTWVVVSSVLSDARRMRGRELSLKPTVNDPHHLTLHITQPGDSQTLDLSQVSTAQWRDDTADDTGLWFYDDHNNPLAHLNNDFLADQAEARLFLRWLRTSSTTNFPVRWPDPTA